MEKQNLSFLRKGSFTNNQTYIGGAVGGIIVYCELYTSYFKKACFRVFTNNTLFIAGHKIYVEKQNLSFHWNGSFTNNQAYIGGAASGGMVHL